MPLLSSRSEQQQLCGPDCKYRSLYEGAQASLADMAAKQAGALNRHGRLRSGIITVLRSALPRQFAELEHRISGRVSDTNDDTLLSYAAYLLETSGTDGRMAGGAAGMEALRRELRNAGFSIPEGFDLATWASAVSNGTKRVDGPSAAMSDDRPGEHPPQPQPSPAANSNPAQRRALPAADPTPATAAPSGPAAPPTPVPGPAGAPTATAPRHEAPRPPAETPDTGWQPRRSRTLQSVAEQLDRVPHTPAYASPLEQPRPSPGPTGEWMGANPPAAQTTPAGPARTTRDDPAGGAVAADAAPQNSVEPAPQAQHEIEPAPAPEPEAAVEPAPATVAPAAAPVQKVVRQQAVRPELFPGVPGAGNGRRQRAPKRTARTNAMPPDPQSDGTVGEATELNAEVREQLKSAVALPRPVFTSDLETLFGAEGVLEQWQTECRADPEAPIRFIPGKKRHRQRGSLVLPMGYLRNAATEFKRSWWAETMTEHTGARLYELAVLLHAVGDQIVSHRIHKHDQTVLLRLTQPRGLVGVVVVLAGALDSDGETRAALAADVEELLSDRLELLVVLAASDPHYQPMVEALSEEASIRGWEPGCHVVAARSWEYADGNVGALKQILG